jgi:hypothetical protein
MHSSNSLERQMPAAKKTIGEMSADSRAVFQRLMKCQVGDIVTYKELTTLTRRDVQGDDRYVLSTAVNACLREGLVFDCVRTEGVKRLADSEIVSASTDALPRIRRIARKATRKLAAVGNFDALPNDAKTQHNVFMSIFGAMAHMSTNSAIGKVESKVREASQSLAIANTLDAFK